MGLLFESKSEKARRERQEFWHDVARGHEEAKLSADRQRMWDERRERKKQENHDALTDDLNELKDEFGNVKGMDKPQDKLEAILSIYAKAGTLIKQANRVGDHTIPDLVKTFQSKLEDTIAFLSKPKNREDQLACLQLLTSTSIKTKKLNKWKKELAQQVRTQYSDDSELLMYCDKVLGKVIPADSTLGTKLKILLGNLIRK
ncbi:MAG: hypothetical protein ILA06_06560 [Bacteroidaceae bacterium]|nr:hypothetical protein [Bacteroidaceae bacterium]